MQNNLRNSLLVNLPYKKSQNSSKRKKIICQKQICIKKQRKTRNKGKILFKFYLFLTDLYS